MINNFNAESVRYIRTLSTITKIGAGYSGNGSLFNVNVTPGDIYVIGLVVNTNITYTNATLLSDTGGYICEDTPHRYLLVQATNTSIAIRNVGGGGTYIDIIKVS